MDRKIGLSRRRVLIAGGVALASIGGGLWSRRGVQDHDSPRLSALQAHERLAEGSLVLVDVRRPDEWRSTGVAPGAVLLDMRRSNFVQH